MDTIWAVGAFDDLRSREVRLLEAASQRGKLSVLLWDDHLIEKRTGKPPKFPAGERLYLLESLRFVDRVRLTCDPAASLPSSANLALPAWESPPEELAGYPRQLIDEDDLPRFLPLPRPNLSSSTPGRPKVIVTGCFDWLHSGHVRFFEQASEYGDLYVTVGNDVTVRALKGEGHPMQRQEERRYMAGAVRFVRQALVSSGSGWLDALPEIEALRPDFYVVNEDGDRPEKQAMCAEHGIQYVVLRRLPKPGLEARSSTQLRGY